MKRVVIETVLSALMFGLLYLALLMAWANSANALTSPLAYPECLPRSASEVAQIASDAEWQAIEIIASGNIGKGIVDDVGIRGDRVLGLFHFPVSAERLYPGPYRDQLAVLYSDAGPRLQLEAWRRLTYPVRRAARQAGCDGHCLTVALALANSAPAHVVEWGERFNWDTLLMCSEYIGVTKSRHRMNRCIALGVL